MTRHDHGRHDHCKHIELYYCNHCDVVYCKDCKREWGKQEVYYYPANYPIYKRPYDWYPFWGTWYGTGSTTTCGISSPDKVWNNFRLCASGGDAEAVSGDTQVCSHS